MHIEKSGIEFDEIYQWLCEVLLLREIYFTT